MDGLALVDKPRSGVENMAIDRTMLDSAAERQVPLLRIYRWANPTVSLGYFQKYSEFEGLTQLAAADCVRRATGGGAIVHHHDWTYSLALPESAVQASKLGAANPIYEGIHGQIVRWLNSIGVPAEQWRGGSEGNSKAFLCFQRRSDGDVVSGAHKVLGSAQRRTRGAILQHGSLLLKASRFAPALAGVAEVLAGRLPDEDHRNPMESSIDSRQMLPIIVYGASSLGVDLRESDEATFFQHLGSIDSKPFDDAQWLKRV